MERLYTLANNFWTFWQLLQCFWEPDIDWLKRKRINISVIVMTIDQLMCNNIRVQRSKRLMSPCNEHKLCGTAHCFSFWVNHRFLYQQHNFDVNFFKFFKIRSILFSFAKTCPVKVTWLRWKLRTRVAKIVKQAGRTWPDASCGKWRSAEQNR